MNVCKILSLGKGEYSASQTYDVLDIVQVGPALYQSKVPNNTGNAVTDTTTWQLLFDTGAAIAAATGPNAPATTAGANVVRLLGIDTNGQPVSITPLNIVQYVIESLLGYDLIARDK